MTSLITGQPKTHFLLRDVLVDLPGRDAVRDVLAKDGDVLRVCESENADTQVADQSALSSLVGDGGAYRARPLSMGGFLFIRLTDLDGDRLAFRLESPAPTGASVTPEGTFAWQPGAVPVPSTNRMTVTVTDNGMPA